MGCNPCFTHNTPLKFYNETSLATENYFILLAESKVPWASGEATHQLCLGPDGAGCSGGLHDACFNMSIRMMVRLRISCLRRLHHLPVFGFALAFKHLVHAGSIQKRKKIAPCALLILHTSATWPSASAWRMPARARTRVLCPRLRSASRCRIAVSRAVASSWSCQVDFGLSLSFFGGVDKML